MRRIPTRLIVMPLLVLAVAGGLAVWGNRRQVQQTTEVRSGVVALCRDLAEGREPSAHLAGTDPLLARQLVERLAPIVRQAAGEGRAVEVVASPGDAGATGGSPAAATHTAVIRDAGREVMGLRVVHTGRGDGGIVIIGLWVPR